MDTISLHKLICNTSSHIVMLIFSDETLEDILTRYELIDADPIFISDMSLKIKDKETNVSGCQYMYWDYKGIKKIIFMPVIDRTEYETEDKIKTLYTALTNMQFVLNNLYDEVKSKELIFITNQFLYDRYRSYVTDLHTRNNSLWNIAFKVIK